MNRAHRENRLLLTSIRCGRDWSSAHRAGGDGPARAHLRNKDDGVTALKAARDRFRHSIELIDSEPEADLFDRLRGKEFDTTHIAFSLYVEAER